MRKVSPYGSIDRSLSWEIQYWTSRGFAVVDVNYGGSTGYEREYRQRLNGQ
jgi:dipeptidyl aminopeptidase/acylaminoacyl peptidase